MENNTMPKKQTKPKYPKEILVRREGRHSLYSSDDPDSFHDGVVVAIYKFDRMAKVKRTVTVE